MSRTVFSAIGGQDTPPGLVPELFIDTPHKAKLPPLGMNKTVVFFLLLIFFVPKSFGADLICPKNHPAKDWAPSVKQALKTQIKNLKKKSRPLATLDWDNTMIYGDVGEATLKHQIDTRAFSFNDDFWRLIPVSVRSRLKALHKNDPQGEFSKLFWQTYENMCATQGDEACYVWTVQLMTGLSPDEVRHQAQNVIKSFSSQGPCYYPQMKKLVNQLKKAGVDVWIVSASTQWIVEEAVRHVGIDADHVIGMLPKVVNGQIMTQMERVTYREGKAHAIQNMIGRAPDFAAGDSNTDLEMLLMGEGTRLVIDRGKEPLMTTARQKGWLIQPKFY